VVREKIRLYCSVFICAILAVAVMAGALPSSAAAAVEMKAWPGLGGLFRVDQPLELLITVENLGPGFRGTITVGQDEKQPEGRRPGLARYILDVDIPADGRSQFRIVIPGELASRKPLVELASGGMTLAEARVEGVAVGGGRVLLALGEDIAGSGLQGWLAETPGSQVNLKYLSPGELPGDSLLLGVADVIMISPSIASPLNEGQVRALKEWVNLGGTLLLFGGAGAAEGGDFADVSPVRAAGRKVVDGKLAGLRSGGPLEVASGELTAGKAMAVENGVPVLARRELGWGEVVYCAAGPRDLGGEARGVWSTLLRGATPGPGDKDPASKRPFGLGTGSDGQLVGPSSYIPRLAGPPAPVLAVLWLVYVAAVGPLLYFLLRRADRRDWAWALAPAVALLAAGAFYLLAPAGRLQGHLTQTVATIEILSPEMAAVRAGATVVAARGGDLTVHAAGNMFAGPSGYDGRADIQKSVLVQRSGEKTTVSFGDVRYSSLRQVYAYGLRRDPGSIEGKLYFAGKNIKGDLLNKTGLDLRDCRLALGGRVIRIGNLSAGETVHIEETLEGLNISPGPEMLLAELGGSRGTRPGDPFFRERQVLSESLHGENGRAASIQFIGWHDGAPGIFEVTGKPGRIEDHGLVLVKQAIGMEAAPGKFRLPAGFIKPRPGELRFASTEGRETKVIYNDNINLVYNIDDAGISGNFEIEALEFQYAGGQFASPVEIYNYQDDKWEQLPDGGRKIGTEELPRYLSGGEVRLRVAGESRGPYPVWPGLAVEGVVS